MVRTQVYLTENEIFALDVLSDQIGKKRSELIREAVDSLITKYNQHKRQKILDRVAGIWKEREDLPNFSSLRKDWDRGHA